MQLRLTPVTMITMASVVILLTTEAIFHWSLRGDVLNLEASDRRAVIVETPRERAHSWTARVRLDEGHEVMLTAQKDSLIATPSVGEALLFHAPVAPPRDTRNPGEMAYGTWLRRHGVSGTAYCKAGLWRSLGPTPQMSIMHQLLRERNKLAQRYASRLEGQDLAVMMAMTLGDRRLVSRDLREDFAAVGASHVLAMSGLHLSILVFLFTWGISRWLSRWRWAHALSIVAGIVLMLCFVLLVGAPPSLVRAATMLGLTMLASIGERRGLDLNNVCLAALMMLIWDARVLFDVGFQLSFVAVAAISVATQRLRFPLRWRRALSTRMQLTERAKDKVARRLLKEAMMSAPNIETAQRLTMTQFVPQRLPLLTRWGIEARHRLGILCRILWGAAVVSLSAQLATLPLVVWYFHTLPLYGLLTSLVVIPLAYLILAGAVIFLLIPWTRPLVAWGLHALINLMIGVVGLCASWPGGHIVVNWHHEPPFVICCRYNEPELRCPQGVWDGNIMLSPQGRVARIDGRASRGIPAQPLAVDYLWLCRGAKGHLEDWLLRYNPRTIVLDATLSDYYHERFALEAADLTLPVYDITEQGALIIE